jgi:RNA recognition motif-containing protein
MGKKLYVGNLSFSVTEQALQSTFAQHGTVETLNLITDRDTGRSKGFGFVEMRTDAEASAAMSELNGADLDGRPMKVNEAKPQARRSDRGGGRSGGNRW